MERQSNGDIYDRLGVRKVINAQARASKIGGSIMHEDVLRAMNEAARSFVDMSEWLGAAGKHLASLIGVEAACIVNSAAAALTVTTAACVAGRDPAKIYRLPDTRGMKNQVIVHRNQRNHYDCCVRAAGIEFMEIGSSRDTFAWELEAALTDQTAAVVYFIAHEGRSSLPLEQVIKIAHGKGCAGDRGCGVGTATAEQSPAFRRARFRSGDLQRRQGHRRTSSVGTDPGQAGVNRVLCRERVPEPERDWADDEGW